MALSPTVRRLAAAAATGIALASTVVIVDSSPALAAVTLHVSKTTVTDGETITAYGTGFTANLSSIALGQCLKDPTGPTDCNLSGGATFVTADANGKTATVTLKLSKKWDSTHNCGTSGCVIATQLVDSTKTDAQKAASKAQVAIKFTSGSSTATATATATSTSSATAAAGSTTTTTTGSAALPTTGPGLEWATMLLIGAALLLPGLGLLAMLPARRRRIAQLR